MKKFSIVLVVLLIGCVASNFELFSYFRHYAILSFEPFCWTFIWPFFNFFSNFFWTFCWTNFIFFSNDLLAPSHPLDSPPTICKLCPINNYNIFFELFVELPPSPPTLPFNNIFLGLTFCMSWLLNFNIVFLVVDFFYGWLFLQLQWVDFFYGWLFTGYPGPGAHSILYIL
jgi:hypothetical protein